MRLLNCLLHGYSRHRYNNEPSQNPNHEFGLNEFLISLSLLIFAGLLIMYLDKKEKKQRKY
jgi:prolipoprotein diacylglyceryltransferase